VRIYFAPCGIGLGHAARLLPIAERFQREGATINFSTYEDAIAFVKRQGFPVISSPPIQFQYGEDGVFDVRRTFAKGPRNLLNFLGQVAYETTSIEAFKPDVVVSDSRLSSLVAARMLNAPRVLIINQLRVLIPHVRELTKRREEVKTFFERVGLEILTTLWHSSPLILVPDFPHPYTISKSNLMVSKRGLERVAFIGPIIKQRPEELPSKESIRKKLDLPARKPVIFANYNGTNLEKTVSRQLLDPLLAELTDEFFVVVSHGLPNGNSLDIEDKNLRVYNWLPQKYEMLHGCDAFISTCGHTSLAEAMYYGVPTLLVPTSSHTERIGNARSVEGFGASLLLKQEDLTAVSLRSAARHLTKERSFHERAKKIQSEISRFNAVDSAVSAIRASTLWS
jgi:UDP-N-acetylglucosamine--N-acetylmuramyl-(pentapeptide) pyrophosphoryl-undecaprenol N-acetylglucosamine transferase